MKKINTSLFGGQSPSDYSTNQAYYTLLMEQYKIYLAATEHISQQRQAANGFFVTINTLLISFVSYLKPIDTSEPHVIWLIALAGLVISFMWYRLVRSYGDLNTAKFKVVHELESVLPARPYDAEWEAVGHGQDPALYLPFTRVEVWIPVVFVGLYLMILVVTTFKIGAL